MNIDILDPAAVTASPRHRPAGPVVLYLPRGAAAATQARLRTTSAGRREALVLWAGMTTGPNTARITHVIEPDCLARRDVLVVPKAERAAVAAFVRAQRLLIFADLHTHPGAAFLSDADRARPFSALPGFYAAVIPDFGARAPLDGWRLYEAGRGTWAEVRLEERIR